MHAQLLSCVQLFATPWTVGRQAPLSVEFPRQEYWSGLPSPSPGDLPDPGMELTPPVFAGGFFTTAPSGRPEQGSNLHPLQWERGVFHSVVKDRQVLKIPHFCSCPSRILITSMLDHLLLSHRFLRLCSFFFSVIQTEWILLIAPPVRWFCLLSLHSAIESIQRDFHFRYFIFHLDHFCFIIFITSTLLRFYIYSFVSNESVITYWGNFRMAAFHLC